MAMTEKTKNGFAIIYRFISCFYIKFMETLRLIFKLSELKNYIFNVSNYYSYNNISANLQATT